LQFPLFGAGARQRFAGVVKFLVVRQRSLIVGDRFTHVAVLLISQSALIVVLRVARIEFDDVVEIPDRLGVSLGFDQHLGAGAQASDIIGIAHETVVEIGESLGRIALGLAKRGALEIRIGRPRVAAYRNIEIADRFGGVAL